MTRNSKWRFSFWPVLAFVVMLPVLLALGSWQVQRGLEKQAAYSDFENATLSEPRDVTALSLSAFNELPDYEPVRVRGRYLAGKDFLLDNMPRDGRPGHHVLTPFQPEGARYLVVVDRGWRPGLALQDPEPPANIESGTRTVSGMPASFPQPGLQLDNKPSYEGWPRVVQFPTAKELSKVLETPVAEYRLLLDDAAAEGFAREWSPPGIPPARHYGYAFQWFGLALALIVIFVLVARPRHPKDDTE